MEQLNRITLSGTVSGLTLSELSGRLIAGFTLVHTDTLSASDGSSLGRKTRIKAVVHECRRIPAETISSLKDDQTIRVVGFIKNWNAILADGTEHSEHRLCVTGLETCGKDDTNTIELRGIIGSIRTASDGYSARAALCTTRLYKDSTGQVILESTWHTLNILACRNIPKDTIAKLEKGSKVSVTGRLTTQAYTTADGEKKSYPEIIPSTIQIIELQEPLSYAK